MKEPRVSIEASVAVSGLEKANSTTKSASPLWSDQVEEEGVEIEAAANGDLAEETWEQHGPSTVGNTGTTKLDEIPPHRKKAWREALAGNRDAGNGLHLDYYPPATPGLVEFSEDDVRPLIEKWEHSLVGAVMGDWVSYYAMEQFVAARWREVSKPRIFRAENGICAC